MKKFPRCFRKDVYFRVVGLDSMRYCARRKTDTVVDITMKQTFRLRWDWCCDMTTKSLLREIDEGRYVVISAEEANA